MRLPAFVRRRPFPWVLAASLVAALVMVVIGQGMWFSVRRNETEVLVYVLQAIGFALPLVAAARWWRRIGTWERRAAVVACLAWVGSMQYHMRLLGGQAVAFAANVRAVGEMTREPLRAMATAPYDAAARALSAGDTSFLATEACPFGADSALVTRYGVRTISGTAGGESLTAEHRQFMQDARDYAYEYNRAIVDRVKKTDPDEVGCLETLRVFPSWP